MLEMIEFLDNYVNGKTLYTKELIYSLEGGSLEGIYSDQISFSNLKYSKTGFQFDMFIVSNEKIYTLDKFKNREKLRKDFSGVSLFRYEMAERKSTNAVTGLFRFISSSGKDIPAEAVVSGIYDVAIDGNILRLKEDQVLYRDQPVREDGFKPVAFQSEHRFFMEDGKLHYEYDGRSFDIDSVSLKRCGTADSFPPFISAEK